MELYTGLNVKRTLIWRPERYYNVTCKFDKEPHGLQAFALYGQRSNNLLLGNNIFIW